MRVCSLVGCFYGGYLLKLALEDSRPPMTVDFWCQNWDVLLRLPSRFMKLDL